jgi:hypothetical protein
LWTPPHREFVIADQGDKDDGTEGAEAPEPPAADPIADVDEAWEGFALDASVFRSPGGRKEDSDFRSDGGRQEN